jgi:cardiolipin synthase
MNLSRKEVLTIPNLLTLMRALGVPLFLWLLLIQNLRGLSFLVLVIGGLTDYFDGKLARLLHQESDLGALLDPAIDRLYIAATVIGLALKHYIPWWLVVVLATRDLWMLAMVKIYRNKTGRVFTVTFLGKAATFNLLYAFPFLLLASHSAWGQFAHTFGWSFAIWGIGLYLLTAFNYSSQALTPNKEPHV